MTLAELNTEFALLRIVEYKADHNTPIVRRRQLQHIGGNLYRGADEQCGNWVNADLFLYYPEHDIGVSLGVIDVTSPVEGVIARFNFSLNDLLEQWDQDAENNRYFNNANLIFTGIVSPERVPVYQASREANLQIKEQEEAKKQKEKDERTRQQLDEKKQNTSRAVAEAIDAILYDGEVHNEDVHVLIGGSEQGRRPLVVYLADIYGITIPLRTRGWMINQLVYVQYKNGEATECAIKDRKRKSRVVFEYLNKIADAVKKEDTAFKESMQSGSVVV